MASAATLRRKRFSPDPGVPVSSLLENRTLAEKLNDQIIGDVDFTPVIDAIQSHNAGLCPTDQPIASFILAGPTGSGKTHTVEVLAQLLHGSKKNVLRVDCGEFQLDHEVAKLIGAPPGYLGHRETQPILSQARINNISSSQSKIAIILFDEIEKAAPSLQRLLLSILDKATIRTGDNQAIDFSRALIFFTSNLGSTGRTKTGFGGSTSDEAAIAAKTDISAAIRKHFSSEFLNRLSGTIVYKTLTKEQIREIFWLEWQAFSDLVKDAARINGQPDLTLQVTDKAIDKIIDIGYSSVFGARELKRTIQKHIRPLVAEYITQLRLDECGAETTGLCFDYKKNEFVCKEENANR